MSYMINRSVGERKKTRKKGVKGIGIRGVADVREGDVLVADRECKRGLRERRL